MVCSSVTILPDIDKYYDCVDGICTEVRYVTIHKNDPTCQNMCCPELQILLTIT